MKIKKYEIANLKVSSIRHEKIYDKKANDFREKHTIKIDNGTISKYFTYTTEVIGLIDYDKLTENAMWCIYEDYSTANYLLLSECDENDFVREFEYEEKEGKKIYKQLINQHNRLEELFDNNTLNMLENEFEGY